MTSYTPHGGGVPAMVRLPNAGNSGDESLLVVVRLPILIARLDLCKLGGVEHSIENETWILLMRMRSGRLCDVVHDVRHHSSDCY